MGRRKSTLPKPQKKFYKLPKQFECPYCNQIDGVKVSISRKDKTARIQCVKCEEPNPPRVLHVEKICEAVDVYDEWMDDVRKQNKVYNLDLHVEEAEDQYENLDESVVFDTKLQKKKAISSSDNDDDFSNSE